jgi:hypothetical protein
MVNRAQPFKHSHIVRAFRAAEAAGVKNPSVAVHLPNGTTIDINGKPDATSGTKRASPPMPVKASRAGPSGKAR